MSFSYLNWSFSLGCLFHFNQCVWRHIQSSGLSTKYQDNETFRLNVKKLTSLAFLPVDDVVAGFDLDAGDFDDDGEDFVGYFEKTRIGEPKRRGNWSVPSQLKLARYLNCRCWTKETTIRTPTMECLRSCSCQPSSIEQLRERVA